MSKKLFLSTLLSLTALASIFTALAPISTQAQYEFGNFYMTTAPKGVNLRDKNCNVVEVIPYGAMLSIESHPASITCKIAGVDYGMTLVQNLAGGSRNGSTGYVYSRFFTPIQSGTWKFQSQARVTATAGLNLRDENCRRVATLPYKTTLNVVGGYIGNSPICQASGKVYMMTRVSYNNKYYYLANSYLENA